MRRRLALASSAAVLLAAAWSVQSAVVAVAAIPGTGCSVFPADNVWNTDISSLPVNIHSAAWLASTGATSGRLLHPDFGGPPYGIPFNVVDSTHATTNFNFLYWDESDPVVATQRPQGPYPYGNDLAIEAPTDSHLLTINRDTCTLYETSGTNYNGASTGWSGAIFNLGSNNLRPDTWTSADAAGLPIFPGLVRLDEVAAGSIKHAIRFTVQQSDTSHLWPARHDAGSASNSNLPPMGARFRLKASYDISSFNTQAQVVLQAMKHYGLIVADNGSNWYFQGTEDAGWNNPPYDTMIAQLKTVPASAFEAVDESSLMISANSAQAVQPCATASVGTSTASPQQRGASITFTAGSTGCSNARYEFWLQSPSGAWTMTQGFSAANSWTWDTSAYSPGSYALHVWANQAGSSMATYQALGAATFTLNQSPPCSSASVTPPSVSVPAGSSINFSASAAGCPYPRYEYWIRVGSSWYLWRPFSTDPTWSLSTAGFSPGTVLVHAWANQAGDQTAALEAVAESKVTLTGCTSATLSPASGTVRVGGTVTFTASSTGCPNPQYEYWVQWLNGSWHVIRGFSTDPTFQWTASSFYAPGTYTIHVWANQQGAYTGALEAVGSSTYVLS